MQFFASYKDRAGVESISVDLLYRASVGDLVNQLRRMFPNLASTSGNVVVAVNAEYATHDQEVHSEDEVALIPPVSGGET